MVDPRARIAPELTPIAPILIAPGEGGHMAPRIDKQTAENVGNTTISAVGMNVAGLASMSCRTLGTGSNGKATWGGARNRRDRVTMALSKAMATGALIDRARRQQRKLGIGFACVWIRENDGGDGSKGSHVHILMHVAPAGARALVLMQLRWLEEIAGARYRAGAIHTRASGASWTRSQRRQRFTRSTCGSLSITS